MIRKVRLSDAEEIAQIYNRYVTESTATFETVPVSAEEMKKRIGDISMRFPYFVWEQDGRVLGYSYAHPWKERAAYSMTLETTVYVAMDAARHGVGKSLMHKLTDECRSLGFHALVACITAENLPSISLHSKLGFTEVSRFHEVGFKFGRWLDIVDMELLL